MRIIQEPNKIALWNKRHFEEKKTEIMQHVWNIQYVYLLNKYLKCSVWRLALRYDTHTHTHTHTHIYIYIYICVCVCVCVCVVRLLKVNLRVTDLHTLRLSICELSWKSTQEISYFSYGRNENAFPRMSWYRLMLSRWRARGKKKLYSFTPFTSCLLL